jgi:UDP-N-acetylmuramate dehydrogenase
MHQHPAITQALRGLTLKEVLHDEPMSRHTSLKLGGRVDALVYVENEDQLVQVIRRLKDHGIVFLAVGNLTNILVRDGGYPGVLISMRGLDHVAVLPCGGETYIIDAQAGASLGRVGGVAAAESLTGLEFTAGIPGSLGGAVRMNAGAFGAEMKDVISDITLLDDMGRKQVLTRRDIHFAYRTSNLPAGTVILSARLKLARGDAGNIRGRMAEILKWRQERHPLNYPNCGSVFKNLPGLPAGRLIEELGLKGMRYGDMQVSKKHANFIVNKGQGTASDMLYLIRLIQETARKERGVELETELVIIGEESLERER